MSKRLYKKAKFNNSAGGDGMKTITIDRTQKPFAMKSRKHQQMIFRDMKEKLDIMYADNFMDQTAHCVEFLDYCRAGLLQFDVQREIVKAEEAISAQLQSLELAERNILIPLLTHLEGCVNESMLNIFPSLEKRSQQLLLDIERKQREDKIDLEPISDFMHDYCRYILFDVQNNSSS